jgi:hypothetical protein
VSDVALDHPDLTGRKSVEHKREAFAERGLFGEVEKHDVTTTFIRTVKREVLPGSSRRLRSGKEGQLNGRGALRRG